MDIGCTAYASRYPVIPIRSCCSDNNMPWIQKPIPSFPPTRYSGNLCMIDIENVTGCFDLTTISTVKTTLCIDCTLNGSFRFQVKDVSPENHRSTISLYGSTCINQSIFFHDHFTSLKHSIRIIKNSQLFIGTSLPISTNQNISATLFTGAIDHRTFC